MLRSTHVHLLTALVLVAVAVTPIHALVVPDRSSAIHEKETRVSALHIPNAYQSVGQLPAELSTQALQKLSRLGASPDRAFVDRRSGLWGTLVLSEPLIPGTGNQLSWKGLRSTTPETLEELRNRALDAFLDYVRSHQAELGIDPAQLGPGRVTVHDRGNLVQIYVPRRVFGVPVRDAYLTAVINHGNLVLFGAQSWGNVGVSVLPRVSEDAGLAKVQEHVAPLQLTGIWRKPELILVPLAAGTDPGQIPVGQGYEYRLAWALGPEVAGEKDWEALVDAQSGELLAFTDTRHYATTRQVFGGVLPVSNDGVPPDGVEQPDYPMPFVQVDNAGATHLTDTGGNLDICLDGDISTSLVGPFVTMNDNCGPILETSATDIDLGTSLDTDCNVAPGASPGNTRASRTGFYELNKIKELARGQLPENVWLGLQLTSNMNLNSTCNAFWNGQVNFYRSGGGCFNTGEIAGVFDHEWGHGMDANDANPGIASPGEGIADIYAALRLNTSCIGRHFRSVTCGGYGDPCTVCTGVRDIDWALRTSGVPHDVAWIDPNCGSGGGTPCGGSTHCEGAVYSEAVWDLYTRDLQGPPYNLDSNTALEVATRLTYIGAGNVGTWFQCVTDGTGGCAANGGYMNYLAADDDNGNLADGTPHMGAIFAAFDRHQIACPTPTVQDGGCAGGPTAAPTVTATGVDKGVSLSWTSVAGATRYKVFRTEGEFGCDFGKVLVGETTGTTFFDSGLKNGRDYSYVVIAAGASDACMGAASSCQTVAPVAGGNLIADATTAALTVNTGDGDVFLDNCETAQLAFDVFNTGTGTQTNVRIVGIDPVSHPAVVVTTPLPATVSASLADGCTSAPASFQFQADGLSFNDTLVFRVDLTSDQLSPLVKSQFFRITSTESDFQTFANKLFSFETDLDGWSVVQGTYNRDNSLGGGNSTTWAVASSNGQDDACDQIRSPTMVLSPTSTLSLWSNFDIEPQSAATWYDRANIGVVNASGTRDLITPNSGRLYNADSNGPGNFTGCNDPEEGWAGNQSTWGSSGWNAVALDSANRAGQLIQLDIIYGTDGALANRGFSFDHVRVTDVDLQVGDAQSDVCVFDQIFADGFESGNTSAWSQTNP